MRMLRKSERAYGAMPWAIWAIALSGFQPVERVFFTEILTFQKGPSANRHCRTISSCNLGEMIKRRTID